MNSYWHFYQCCNSSLPCILSTAVSLVVKKCFGSQLNVSLPELYYDRGNHHEFVSLVKDLARPGELTQSQTFDFEFTHVEKPYESYTGQNVKLRWALPCAWIIYNVWYTCMYLRNSAHNRVQLECFFVFFQQSFKILNWFTTTLSFSRTY